MSIHAQVDGLDSVKKFFADMDQQLRASELRWVLDEAGKVVIKEAKKENPLQGIVRELFNKDLGVYRDNRSRQSTRGAEYVLVGPRFKPYTIHGQEQKIAVIAQHMTEGFQQTNRKGRGKVKTQTFNPVLNAYRETKEEQNKGIGRGIEKAVKKIKAKNEGLVK